MAGNVKGITVEIGGDTTKLGKALDKSEKQSKDLQKELKQVNTALKFSPDSIELVTQKQKILTEQIEATKDKLETLKAAEAQVEAQFKAGEIGEEQYRAFQREIVETESKLKTYQSQLEATGKKASALDELTATITEQENAVEQLKDEYKEAVLTYGKNSDEAKELAKQLDELSGELKENKDKMADLDDEADKLDNNLDDVESASKKTTDGFTVMRGALADLISSGIQAAIRGLKDLADAAIEAYTEFDEGRDNVIKATGATGEAAEKLTGSYKKVAQSVVGDLDTIGSALGEINTRFGWTGDKLEGATEQFVKFAEITGVDATEAVKLVSRAMENAGIDSDEYATVLDQLAVAGQASGTSIDNLAENLTKFGTPMREMGLSTAESIAMLAQFEKSGVNTEVALAGMRKALQNWTKDGKDAGEEFGKVVQQIKDAPDTTQATAIAMENFGNKAGPELADAIRTGRFEYSDFLDLIEGSSGTVTETYEQTQDGFDKINLAIQGAKTELGDFTGNLLDKYQPQIEKAISKASDLIKIMLEKIGDLFTFISNNGDEILAVLKAIATAFVVYKAVSIIMGVVEAFQALRVAIVASESVMAAFNTTMKLNPIGLVASAIAGLIVLLVSLKDETKANAEATYGLSEAQKELNDKIAEEAQAVREATEARQEAMGAVESETAYNKQLWDELQSIVDANGTIKEGYQERAAVITGLLSDALGIEISIVDGQIQKYDELKKSVEEVIETKRTEALLEAAKADYTDAIQKQAKAYEDYQQKLRDFAAAQEEIREAEEKVETARAKAATGRGALVKQYNDAKAELDAVNEKYKEQKKALSDSEQTYLQYANTIQQYEGALAAMASGDVGALNEALGKLTNNFLTADNATKAMLEDQLTSFRSQYQSMKEAVEAGMPGVTQEQVDQMALLVSAAETELDKLAPKAKESTKKAGEAAAEGTTSTVEDNRKAAKIVAAKVKEALESTDTKASGKKKGDDYGAGIKETGDANNQAGKQVAEKAKAGLDSSDTKATGKKKGDEYTGGISSVMEGAKKAGEKVAQNAKAGAESVKMNNSGKKAGDEYSTGIGTKSTSARNAAKGVANSGLSGFSQVSAYQTGQSFSSGFAGGIGSLSKTVENTARNIAANAVAAMQRALNSHSPSKVTEKIGEDFDSGFILGIDNLTDKAIKTARAMASGAVQALTGVGDINIGEPSFSGLQFGRQLDNTFGQMNGPDFSEILAKLDTVTKAITDNSGNAIVLDTGALVGATVNQYDSALARVYGMKARGI